MLKEEQDIIAPRFSKGDTVYYNHEGYKVSEVRENSLTNKMERKLDHHYADSFEQARQITENIEKMENKLAVLEQKLHKGQGKSSEKSLVKNEKADKSKNSVLGAIQKYKTEDKDKSNEARKLETQNER